MQSQKVDCSCVGGKRVGAVIVVSAGTNKRMITLWIDVHFHPWVFVGCLRNSLLRPCRNVLVAPCQMQKERRVDVSRFVEIVLGAAAVVSDGCVNRTPGSSEERHQPAQAKAHDRDFS